MFNHLPTGPPDQLDVMEKNNHCTVLKGCEVIMYKFYEKILKPLLTANEEWGKFISANIDRALMLLLILIRFE